MTIKPKTQSGASLIEVLITILILSFGMLSLGGMMAYSIQAPKLAAYRATAVAQAGAFVERMRANKAGFSQGFYQNSTSEPISYKVLNPTVLIATACVYPACTAQSIANYDAKETIQTLRRELSPLSGLRVVCKNSDCPNANYEGDLWVLWDEPEQLGKLNFSGSDECPDNTIAPPFSAFTGTLPRCVHIRFKL
jgi:type IV pilus assembly protein PilV